MLPFCFARICQFIGDLSHKDLAAYFYKVRHKGHQCTYTVSSRKYTLFEQTPSPLFNPQVLT